MCWTRITAAALAACMLAAGAADDPFRDVDPRDPRLMRISQYAGLGEEQLEMIRAQRGVPPTEQDMSIEEVLEALGEGERWARPALALRASRMTPVEFIALAREMHRLAPAAVPPHTRLYASVAAEVLPAPLMLPVAWEALFGRGELNDRDIPMFVSFIVQQDETLPEAAPLLRQLYWQARGGEAVQADAPISDPGSIHHFILTGLGYCGAEGIDPILETEVRAAASARALGRIGTPRAHGILVEWLAAGPAPDLRRACLAGLTQGGTGGLTDQMRRFVRQEMAGLFEAPEAEVRREVARLAGASDDAGLLPALVALRDSDPDAQVREAAAQAVDRLWNRGQRQVERALEAAREKLEEARETIAVNEYRMQVPRYSPAEKEEFAAEIERTRQTLRGLEAEVEALETQKQRFLQGEAEF